MAQLDRFFQVLLEREAQELRMVSGEAPVFLFETGHRPASSAKPSADQLLGLLAEVLGVEKLEEARTGGMVATRIDRPGIAVPLIGTIRVQGTRVEAVFRAVRSAAGAAGAAAPPAPTAAPAAQTAAPAPSSVTVHAKPGNGTPEPSQPAVRAAAAGPAAAVIDLSPAGQRGSQGLAKDAEDPPVSAGGKSVSVPTSRTVTEDSPPAVRAAGPVAKAPVTTGTVSARVEALPGEPEIARLLRRMVAERASDLHLSSGEIPIVRVDGEIVRLADEPALAPERVRELVRAIMPERHRAEYDEISDTDWAYEVPGLARFRSNAFVDRKGPGAVFRQIPSKILTAEQLGLSEKILELCHLTKGLVLVTGPTGSGKSTTLTAMIDHINKTRTDHVLTIEDPIEFVHENIRCLVNQREVGTHTSSFKKALRAALREDPDIVLVGELRDLETIAIAIETAETGHLVFGTLHTTTAVGTIDRIIDQFPQGEQAQVRTMLAECLRGVIAQTLCKKIGGGRAAALEVLIGTPSVSNLVREGKTFQIPSIMQTGKKLGMVSLNDALLSLVKQKLVEPEEALRRAVDKANLANAMKTAGFDVASASKDRELAATSS